MYSLQFPTFTEYQYAMDSMDRTGVISNSKVWSWLLYGRLPESIYVVPQYTTVEVEASGKNRYLTDVTVRGIEPANITVSLATAATLTLKTIGMGSATSSNTAYATAAIVGDVLTITAVAAGTAVITVKDKANDTMYTVTVTVA